MKRTFKVEAFFPLLLVFPALYVHYLVVGQASSLSQTAPSPEDKRSITHGVVKGRRDLQEAFGIGIRISRPRGRHCNPLHSYSFTSCFDSLFADVS